MKYDAFISYRHCEPDKSVAETIQKKLESYRLPSDVAEKVGKKRLERVFRDEAEFAISHDLSEAIMAALKDSEYLIVICTPRLKLSEWCRKEIETFLTIRDRRHILLVLAEGEPDEVFPEVLTYEEVTRLDTEGHEVRIREKREPLAADCRGNTKKERRHNMDRTVLRLVASILGLGFDDLRQRHRMQRAKKRTLIILTIFIIVFLILAQSFYFLVRLGEQNRMIREKYEDSIASVSERLLEDGRRLDAIYAARSILPDDSTGHYNVEALRALVAAEGLYSTPMEFLCEKNISIPSGVADIVLSPDGSLLGAKGINEQRYIIDTQTGQIIYDFPEKENATMAFDGTDGIVCCPEGKGYLRIDLETWDEAIFYENENAWVSTLPGDQGCILFTGYDFRVYHSNQMVYSRSYEELGFTEDMNNFYPELKYSADGKHGLLLLWDYLNDHFYIIQFALEDGAPETLLFSKKQIGDAATDGKTLVYSVYEDDNHTDMCIFDVAGQEMRDVRSFEGETYYAVGINGGVAVFCGDTKVRMYDLEDVSISAFGIKAICTNVYNFEDILAVTDYNGGVYLCNGSNYRYLEMASGNNGDEMITTCIYGDGKFYFYAFGEESIGVYTRKQSPYCVPYEGEEIDDFGYQDDLDEGHMRFREAVCAFNSDIDPASVLTCIFSTDGKYGVIQLWNMDVRIYDLQTMEEVKVLYDCDGFCSSMYYREEEGLYYLSASGTYVFNEDMEYVMRLKGMYVYGIRKDTGEIVMMDDIPQMYTIHPLTYEEIIREADEQLGNYEPDASVQDKYGF